MNAEDYEAGGAGNPPRIIRREVDPLVHVLDDLRRIGGVEARRMRVVVEVDRHQRLRAVLQGGRARSRRARQLPARRRPPQGVHGVRALGRGRTQARHVRLPRLDTAGGRPAAGLGLGLGLG